MAHIPPNELNIQSENKISDMYQLSLDEKMDLLKFTNEQRCSKHDSKSEANVVKTIFAHVRK